MAHPAHVLRPADHLSFPGTTSLLFLPSITNLTRSFPVFMSPFIPAPSISYIYMFPHTRNHLRNTVNAFRLLLKCRRKWNCKSKTNNTAFLHPQRQDGGSAAILSAVEQPRVDPGGRVWEPSGQRVLSGRHPFCRGKALQSPQSSLIRVLAILPGQ